MPHLVVDDWSLRVLADDFAKLLQPDPPTTVPIPDAGLLDFVAWEAVTASSDIDSAIRDRRASLASASTLAFAVMPGADPLAQADEADSATFEVPVEVMAAVHRLATTSRVSLFAVLATGYMLTLRNWTGVEDVAVAAPVANRMRPEFERTVGMFANTLVIRAHIDLSATFTGLLHRVSADWLEAMKYAHVPFGALADVARARGVIDGASLPRAAVVLNASTADRPGVVTVSEHARSDSAPSEYDLVLAVRPIDAGGALAELTSLLGSVPSEPLRWPGMCRSACPVSSRGSVSTRSSAKDRDRCRVPENLYRAPRLDRGEAPGFPRGTVSRGGSDLRRLVFSRPGPRRDSSSDIVTRWSRRGCR
jgi:hypothetical protein